jgi:photosystem II stability/assembly factor-like uncharacterized protein
MRAAALLAVLTLSAHAQWALQQSNTTADLRGIDNVGHGIAWASGTNGTVLHTTDNGATWLLCKTPPDADHLDFRGIQAFDADTAIVMSSGKGDLSRLYKTTDGCQTWKLAFTNPDKDGFWDAITFDTARTGMLIGDPVKGRFPLFSTIDRGNTWSRVDHVPLPIQAMHGTQPTSESIFAASNSTLMIREDPSPDVGLQILFLTGGGPSWIHDVQVFNKPIPLLGGTVLTSTYATRLSQGQTAGGFSFAGLPGSNPFLLIAVGGDYQQPDSTALSAARCTWTDERLSSHFLCESPTEFPHGYRSAVAYDAPTHTWITVGPNGTDISTDDGRNWRALKPSATDTPDADQHWNALSLPFVVGPHGRIGILLPTALQPAKSP